MSVPALSTPAEVLDISPEALEIANTYLQVQNIDEVADTLGVSKDTVSKYLDKKEVRNYISNVFLNLGFNNRFQFRSLLDSLIQKKLQEMDEAGIGSSKDITEILALSHKFTLEYMAMELKLKEAENKGNIRNQTNVQINDASGGTKYENLLNQIFNAPLPKSNQIIESE